MSESPLFFGKSEDEFQPLRKSNDAAGDTSKIMPLGKDREWFLQKAFEQGDEHGCAQVFKHYYAPLCSHAVRFVYSKEVAEDIVAEVFREFWQKRHFANIKTSFRTYLFKAVRNRTLNYLQREFATKELPEDLTIVEKSPLPDEQIAFEQLNQRIQEEIGKLPPQCQKVFLMSRFEGKSTKEVAEVLNISARTVESHISKALSVLRAVLKSSDLLCLIWLFHL